MIECKARRQNYQVQTILADEVPDDYVIQVQTGLLVSERKWCDFISYHGGLPMRVIRVEPDLKMQAAIVEAASSFESRLAEMMREYRERISDEARFIPTERTIEQEMYA